MSIIYKQGATDVVHATFIDIPDATPTILALKADGTTDATITFGAVTGSNGNRTYSSLMTIDPATPVGPKNIKWTAVTAGITDEGYDTFYVSAQLIDDLGSLGDGNFNLTVNVKDQDTNNVDGVKITIHNASNDETPKFGPLTTDVDGNAGVFTVDGDLTVRGQKAGFIMNPTAISVTGDGTENVTGTIQTITPPADPDVCRLVIFPINLDNTDVLRLQIYAYPKDALSVRSGQFVANVNRRKLFLYDAGTTPDSYYFDALRSSEGETVTIIVDCPDLGIDKEEVEVPNLATKDLSDLIDVD